MNERVTRCGRPCEKEYGRAIQALLRVEAMEQQLAEESVAEELRREKESAGAAAAAGEVIIEDIFSKDFGKTRAITGNTIDPDRVSSAFRRQLAYSLGYSNLGDLNDVVDRGRAARRALVTHNVGLALSISKDIYDKINDSDKGLLVVSDLAMEGCAGLARAADKFDPARGYRFSTYAYYWTRKAAGGRPSIPFFYTIQTTTFTQCTGTQMRLSRPMSDRIHHHMYTVCWYTKHPG